ncbi:amidohydrolase 2 [Lepidopterella palustris CBS 459.81]|uniref:6-methylsalicylate decarboxylase n=1 Tax=Lepidopterella palustris CBS 459.81 TaxID=1314670 RepID=A0A8E2DWR1_9PEZI|nr:amidohydrolase 2 [Lepidopterella palustris CBS 459.81]
MAHLKIDTHQHVFPPQIKRFMEGSPLSQGFSAPAWSPEMSLDFMAGNNIGTSILSYGIPVTVFGKEAAETAAMCREINEYLASLRDQDPSKFGFFTTLPSLEDVPRCIEEICYAFSVLKADGVNLFTSYNDKYLGHPDFEPVWAELDRHAAVVFIHPTMEGMEKSITEPFLMPRAVFDWPHETTRTAMHLIITNTVRKFPACKRILSHGGGTLPYVAGRIEDANMQARFSGKEPGEFLEDAKSFYFDLALVGHTGPLQLLMNFAKKGHILYGSDYPFVREDMLEQKTRAIDGMVDGDGEELVLVARKAAQTLFPRLKGPVN